MVLLSVSFEYVENLGRVYECWSGSLWKWLDDRCVLLVDYSGLAFGSLLVLSCCSASPGKSLRSLLRLNRAIPCFRCMIY